VSHTIEAVILRDDGQGKSVTNDAEAVVKSVAQKYPGLRIFYVDTQEKMGELIVKDGEFAGFRNHMVVVDEIERPFLRKLLLGCTARQMDMFGRMYGHVDTMPGSKIHGAIDQVQKTLKKNGAVGTLRASIREFE